MSSVPQDYDVLDFESIEESWNEYELSDGNKLKGRVILTRIFQIFDKPQAEGESYQAERQKFFVTYAPSTNRKAHNFPKSNEELNSQNRIPVKILSSNERWNVYRIIKNGKILKAKLIVDEVYQLEGIYDAYGMPFYQISSAEMIVPGKGSKSYTQ